MGHGRATPGKEAVVITRRPSWAAAAALTLVLPVLAATQTFGTFTWQMRPYCNRIALTLNYTPAGFTLDGSDDQCAVSGGSRGSAYGVATFTPAGSVALNFTLVPAPSGKAIHVSALVDPGTGNGTWQDSAGRTGAFTLGTTAGGSARPDPTTVILPGSVGAAELVDGGVTTSKLAAGAVTAAKVDGSQVQLRVSGACAAGQLMLGVNADGTVQCGTASRPAANLECVSTTYPTFTLAPGASTYFTNPACPAGYTAIQPFCWTPAAGVFSRGNGYVNNLVGEATFCAWQNTTNSSQVTFGGNVCCRTPAQ